MISKIIYEVDNIINKMILYVYIISHLHSYKTEDLKYQCPYNMYTNQSI